MRRVILLVQRRREDILLFVASLCVAILLFLQLQPRLASGREREFDVPLTFIGLSDTLTVVKAPRTVRVLASGTQQAINELEASRVTASIDLADAVSGTGRYVIEVDGPKRRGLEYSPLRQLAEVAIEKSLTTEFDVTLTAVGTPPEGLTFEGSSVSPSRVSIQGPASSIESVKSVRAVLDVSSLAPGRTKILELEALDENGQPVTLINFEPRTVEVTPAVSIGPSTRQLLVTPVIRNQPAPGYRVVSYSVVPNQVEVTGATEDVSRFTVVDTEPIDLSGRRATYTISVKLRLPERLEAVTSDTVTVRIVIQKG